MILRCDIYINPYPNLSDLAEVLSGAFLGVLSGKADPCVLLRRREEETPIVAIS
jgi:hypothetical protein